MAEDVKNIILTAIGIGAGILFGAWLLSLTGLHL
jgi:hypothetical protein